jgi:hypothetical protein
MYEAKTIGRWTVTWLLLHNESPHKYIFIMYVGIYEALPLTQEIVAINFI